MATKKSFVLRIDDATFAALEKWAADDFRSVNGHIEWLLTKSLKEASRMPKPRKSTATDAPTQPEDEQNIAS